MKNMGRFVSDDLSILASPKNAKTFSRTEKIGGFALFASPHIII
jgi:hypothetical protein